MQWAIRRHPHKRKKWIKDKYFKRRGTCDGCFFGEFKGGHTVLLNHAASVEKIVRY
ncbi:Group II intron, maturase-specific domain protein (fragment) [Candidatus Methylobacter favarea]|uniref:Group II intron, maturase-specific domain protein n=1 Tax=Candidatus Methylobacter favarea TaxID=2707345 RepID=A0A8S0WH86_9GAMM